MGVIASDRQRTLHLSRVAAVIASELLESVPSINEAAVAYSSIYIKNIEGGAYRALRIDSNLFRKLRFI